MKKGFELINFNGVEDMGILMPTAFLGSSGCCNSSNSTQEEN